MAVFVIIVTARALYLTRMAPSQPVLTASALNTAASSMAKPFKTKSAVDWTLQHSSPFFFAKLLKLCQVARGSGANSPFQVRPQILYWIEAWALTWPLQKIHLVVFKRFLCRFRCMLWVIILAGKIDLRPSRSSLADRIWLCSRIVAAPLLNQVSHFEGGEYSCSHFALYIFC